MRNKRWILTVSVVVLLLVATVGTVVASPTGIGPDGIYLYRIKARGDGSLKVSISLANEAYNLPRYRALNSARARDLIQQQELEPIYVQVTFAQPLPWEIAKAIADTTGFRANSYMMVGTGKQGEKASTIFFRALDEGAPPEIEVGPRGQVTTLKGVMVMQGYVPATPEGLGALVNDPRVYLADTTAVEVRRAIESNPVWRGKRIESIGMPSPFWSLVWP